MIEGVGVMNPGETHMCFGRTSGSMLNTVVTVALWRVPLSKLGVFVLVLVLPSDRAFSRVDPMVGEDGLVFRAVFDGNLDAEVISYRDRSPLTAAPRRGSDAVCGSDVRLFRAHRASADQTVSPARVTNY